MKRTILGASLAVLLLGAAACGGEAAGGDPLSPPAIPEPTSEPGFGDDFPTEEARQQAQGLLGTDEADVPDDVRVARRGSESFALTADYELGRITVELDDTDGSGFRVVLATVELPDGPETFELTPG